MASYRAGEYLGDRARGETFDYTRKEGVEWSNIYAPKNAPEWATDRQELWNRVETAEIRKDAQLAREIEASLPREASPEQWREMVGELAGHFTRYGLVADASIHNVKARDGGDNPHVHMLITMRPMDADGFRASKKDLRFLNSDLALKDWRQAWEGITNRALEAAGSDARLSLQSYAARGIDQEPTKSLGPKASTLEKQGKATPRGDENRRIMAENALREEHRKRLQDEASDGGRVPLWSDFSTRLSAGTDAARDAVHRFRQKDAEREPALSDRPRGSSGSAPAAPSTGTTTGTGQTASQSANAAPQPLRGAEMAARLNDAGMAAVKAQVQEAGRGLANAGTEYKGNVSQGDNVSPNTTPAQPQNQTTQRYQGRTLDSNDSPRMQPAPGRGAAGSAGSAQGAGQATGQGAGQETAQRPSAPNTPGEQTRGSDMGARLGDGARPETKPATNTISQQNPATMQQGARDAGPKQSEQQHQGAAVGKGQEQTGASGKEALNAYYDQHGGKSSEADKNISQQKQQTQEQGRDDR